MTGMTGLTGVTGSNSRHEIEEVVNQVSQLLHTQIGLRPETSLRGRLRRCIRDDAQGRGQDLDSYLKALLGGGEVLQGLLNRVTVQETAFFRHPEHFELMAHEILPALASPVILWSAGCANGQEAYSLAMLLEEGSIQGQVIATDVSTNALQRTGAARYSTREISGLSTERIARHLARDGESWLINSNIRARVRTLQHNLTHPLPLEIHACQVVFCRNVLIYFSAEHASAFLDQVADALPAASLFLGSAETIWQLTSRFQTVRSGDAFSYRRSPDASRPTEHRSRAVAPITKPSRGISKGSRPPSRNSRSDIPPAVGRSNPAVPPRPPSTPSSPGPAKGQPASLPAAVGDVAAARLLARAGERASAAGDASAAVVAFRKCAYLAPDDPIAHLHLGLALESAGDRPAAQRAFAAARRALTQTDPALVDHATGGYTTADLIRLLQSKQQMLTP